MVEREGKGRKKVEGEGEGERGRGRGGEGGDEGWRETHQEEKHYTERAASSYNLHRKKINERSGDNVSDGKREGEN